MTSNNGDYYSLQAAAHRLKQHLPNPAGEALAEIINTWLHHGYRFGGRRQMDQLVEHLPCDPYDMGFGQMCAKIYEGHSTECCAYCTKQTLLGSYEPRSQSESALRPQL